jgi:hypothetical protein
MRAPVKQLQDYADFCYFMSMCSDDLKPKLRQIDNFSRRYYDKELGAGVGPSMSGTQHFGYTEPFRRFVQNETFSPQANEIPNDAPSWLPGDDYYTNFHKGDQFNKVSEGYARLPGAGYEALHPELEGVDPEDYPSIHKMAILADVAPYSHEYNTRSLHLAAHKNPRAGAIDAPPRFGFLTSSPLRSEVTDRRVSSSCRTTKSSRVRDKPKTPSDPVSYPFKTR